MKRMHQGNRQGFTLLELSIVIVIIGLLAGGVLVGRDMIEAAKIRATVSQYEKFNTALNVFQGKYNCLPGDCAKAASLLSYAITAPTAGTAGGVGNGNGDGQLQMANNATGVQQMGENVVFWRHLSDSGLIAEHLGANLGAGTGAMTTSAATDYYPAAKLANSNYFMAQAAADANYFFLTGISGISTPASGLVNVSLALSPQDAYGLDSKIDDGKPNTGVVTARGMNGTLGAVNPITGLGGYGGGAGWVTRASLTSSSIACQTSSTTYNDADNDYNMNAAFGGNTPACNLLMRMN